MEKASKIADYYNECYLIMANFMALEFIRTQLMQAFTHINLSDFMIKSKKMKFIKSVLANHLGSYIEFRKS